MALLRAVLSPLLAAWLVLLSGIAPAQCLLMRHAATASLCAPSGAPDLQPVDHAPPPDAGAFCPACGAMPAVPPSVPAQAGPAIAYAPTLPLAERQPAPAGRPLLRPPARAPPTLS